MKIKNPFKLGGLLGGITMGIAVGPASAAVTVTNTATSAEVGSASATTFSSFAVTGTYNAVVALVSYEQSGTGAAATIGATYGGVAMTQVTINQGQQRASVFYALGVTSGLDLVVTPGAGGSFMSISTLALAGVAGVGDTATDVDTSGTQVDLIYDGQAGGLAVAAYIDNSFAAGIPFIVSPNAFAVLNTVIQSSGGNQGGASSGSLQAYGSIAADIAADDKLQEGSSSSREAAALVTFTTIPEPSAALLGGLGLLGLLRRRRA